MAFDEWEYRSIAECGEDGTKTSVINLKKTKTNPVISAKSGKRPKIRLGE